MELSWSSECSRLFNIFDSLHCINCSVCCKYSNKILHAFSEIAMLLWIKAGIEIKEDHPVKTQEIHTKSHISHHHAPHVYMLSTYKHGVHGGA